MKSTYTIAALFLFFMIIAVGYRIESKKAIKDFNSQISDCKSEVETLKRQRAFDPLPTDSVVLVYYIKNNKLELLLSTEIRDDLASLLGRQIEDGYENLYVLQNGKIQSSMEYCFEQLRKCK